MRTKVCRQSEELRLLERQQIQKLLMLLLQKLTKLAICHMMICYLPKKLPMMDIQKMVGKVIIQDKQKEQGQEVII